MAIAREHCDDFGLSGLLNILGINRFLSGNLDEAKALYRESAEAARRCGNATAELIAISNLAEPAILFGDFHEVRSIAKETIRLIRIAKAWSIAPAALEYMAIVASHERQFERAATLWGAAERMRVDFAKPINPCDLEQHTAQLSKAQSECGDIEAFDRAWSQGSRMTLEAALAHAMGEST